METKCPARGLPASESAILLASRSVSYRSCLNARPAMQASRLQVKAQRKSSSAMKNFILMRHSYAASNNPAWSDHERPLTEHGRQVARQTAGLLNDFPVNRIVHSDAARTSQTAELIRVGCGYDPQLHAASELYLASPDTYLKTVADVAAEDDSGVMVVGHNPGMASLIQSLAEDSLPITPGSVAIFQLNGNDWKSLRSHSPVAELRAFISEGVRRDNGTTRL